MSRIIWYKEGLRRLNIGMIDWEVDNMRVVYVSDEYYPDENDVYLSDIPKHTILDIPFQFVSGRKKVGQRFVHFVHDEIIIPQNCTSIILCTCWSDCESDDEQATSILLKAITKKEKKETNHNSEETTEYLTKLLEDYKQENASLRERVDVLERIESAILEQRLMLTVPGAMIFFDKPIDGQKLMINIEASTFGDMPIEEIWETLVFEKDD